MPRLGLAYRPFGNNTVIRAFYIGTNTRQDEWGYDIKQHVLTITRKLRFLVIVNSGLAATVPRRGRVSLRR